MAIFFFDQETDGLVRDTCDGDPKHRLAVLENDGDLIIRVEANGLKTDLHLSGQQALSFIAACGEVGDRMRLIWTKTKD